jgi:hypothetical protein
VVDAPPVKNKSVEVAFPAADAVNGKAKVE